jgi:hypothetical protein
MQQAIDAEHGAAQAAESEEYPRRRPSQQRRARGVRALAPATLLAALVGWSAHGQAQQQQKPLYLSLTCTPTHVRPFGEAERAERNSLAWALTHAAPGALIELSPGDYAPIAIGFDNWSPDSAKTSGGRPGQPIVVRGGAGVRMVPRTSPDTLSVVQQIQNGWIRFEEIEFIAGSRAAIIFYRTDNAQQEHRGYEFIDCNITARYDPFTDQGERSKWGVWGSQMADFVFKGVKGRATIANIRGEHAFYLQNPKGDLTIEKVDGRLLGRTFFQLTARPSEGPSGVGQITLRDCRVEDAGIARDDAFKGGAAITIAGGSPEASVLVERCVVRAGFDERVRALTMPGVPYGTGAFVAWDGGEDLRNGPLVLRDNVFEFAPGCGDRMLVAIGGCTSVSFEGKNEFRSGGKQPALELDPLDFRGNGLMSPPNGKVSINEGLSVQGDVRVRGKAAKLAELVQRGAQPEAAK